MRNEIAKPHFCVTTSDVFFWGKCVLEIFGRALNFSYVMLLGNLHDELLIKSSKKSILTIPNQICCRDSDIEPIKWLS